MEKAWAHLFVTGATALSQLLVFGEKRGPGSKIQNDAEESLGECSSSAC